MNSYYQQLQDETKKITFSIGPNFTFPPHFHQKLEIFFLRSGQFGVTRNGKPYRLNSGDIMLFDSYDVHSYDKRDCDVEGLVIIIPPNTAENFFSRKGGKKIINPLISDSELCEKLFKLGKEYVSNVKTNENVKNAAVELILSLLEEKLSFSESDFSDETTLAQSLLSYISSHFKSELSLSILSKKFGYSPEHISRIFHRYVNLGLPDFVNGLRLDYINQERKKGNKANITDLLFEAGFKSIQSYYRAKNKHINNP